VSIHYKGSRDPEQFCPICGTYTGSGAFYFQHRCNEKVLRKIDGAMRSDGLLGEPHTLTERFKDGFSLMHADGEQDEPQ
jgi:hypothetical protein